MELTLGESVYKTGNLDTFKQLHVARKLAPALFALGKSAAEALEKKPPEGVPGAEVMILEAFKPMADILAQMSDADVEYIIGTCLAVCQRQDPTSGKWQGVRNPNGRLQFDDINLQVMIQLAVAVIKENVGDFFPTPPASTQ